jgi:2-phosphosulfolactate phosphatase
VKVSVFHTPEQIPTDSTPDCAIAIDVLRATTTITAALHAGAEAVQAFSDLDELIRVSDAWPAHQRLRAGERGGSQVDGFDFGNSPLACTPDRMAGRRLFISTTNGTRALTSVKGATAVLAVALINRQAAVDYLAATRPETVWIVGSGWEGTFALEDTVCAGAILDALQSATGLALGDLAGNDEAIAATALFVEWGDRLLELLQHASHGKRLMRLNCHEDLVFCAQLDQVTTLPMQHEPGVLVAREQLAPAHFKG